MKKNVSLLISICCIMSLFNFSASADELDVSFRDIPFGTAFEDVLSALEEQGVIIDSPDSLYRASLDDSVEGLPIVNVSGLSVADIDGVKASYQFICPYENDTSVESSVLYRGKYTKTIFDTYNHEFNDLSKRLKVALDNLYGEPISVDSNIQYGILEQSIVKWEKSDIQITLNISITYTGGLIAYVGVPGYIDLKITYEDKTMLEKEEHYKDLDKQRKTQKEIDEILSHSSSDGL